MGRRTELDGAAHLRLVSLRSIATLVDAHRSTVRRWLATAGIRPVIIGRGRKGAIRYRWSDIERWIESLEEGE